MSMGYTNSNCQDLVLSEVSVAEKGKFIKTHKNQCLYQ